MISELHTANKAVGLKQSLKKLRSGEAKKAFVARDATPSVTDDIIKICEESFVPAEWVGTMDELGRACGIEVGAAVAVVY